MSSDFGKNDYELRLKRRRHGYGNEDSRWTTTGFGRTRDLGFMASYVSKTAFAKKSPHFVRILMDWRQIAGEDLARLSHPKKLAANVLTLTVAGPASIQIRHMEPVLIERVNMQAGLVGDMCVKRLKIVQGVLPVFEESSQALVRKKRMMRGTLDVQELERELADVPDDELRSSLIRLARSLFMIEEE